MRRTYLLVGTLIAQGFGLPHTAGCGFQDSRSAGPETSVKQVAQDVPPTNRGAPTTARTARTGLHALLIGIAKYRRGRSDNLDWWDLNATNDVDVMEQILQERFEFQPGEIVVLKNEKAHRQGILDAFAELAKATKENDVVYVHYSGHGQRVPDETGEEIDGWAQSIVPFDYVSRADPSKNIVNREFRKLIADLKTKKPANVTLVFDCCFAGEITKGGDEVIRGEDWRGDRPKAAQAGRARFAKGPIGLFPPKAAAAEGYVVLGASRYDLVAQETTADDGRKMGLLTYALIEAIRDARPPRGQGAASTDRGTTYRDVFGQINDVVTWRSRRAQSPQLEGDIDQVLLSGVVRKPSRFVEVSVPQSGSPITLQAGSLQGVTKSSLYSLYPEKTLQFARAKPIAEAIVKDVRIGSATLELTGGTTTSAANLHRTRAVERKHNFGDNRLKVDLRHLARYHPKGKALAEDIRKLGPVAPEGQIQDADLRLVRRGKDKTIDRTIKGLGKVLESTPWVVVRRDGSIAAAFPDDDRLAGRMGLLIEDEVRWRGIMRLRNTGPADLFKVELRVVPVNVRLGDNRLVEEFLGDKDVSPTDGHRLALAEGEYIMIEVRVAESAPYNPYVAVLDLLPNGQVGVLWPLREMKAESKKISADGKWHRFPFPFVWQISLPTGPRYGPGSYTPVDRGEVFNVFATQTYLPMHLLADPPTARGMNVRGLELGKGGDLAELIRAAVGGSRADPVAVAPEYWSSAAVSIDIAPRVYASQ